MTDQDNPVDEPQTPEPPYVPMSTDPLLASLVRGKAPADSLAYASGVVVVGPAWTPPTPRVDEPEAETS